VSIELVMLTLSTVLGIVQILLASHAASLQRGYRWTASPRDSQVAPLQGVAGRLDRALRNFLETFRRFRCLPPSFLRPTSRTHTTRSLGGARNFTSGLGSRMWRCMPPEYR
jgi:hypothetical protein